MDLRLRVSALVKKGQCDQSYQKRIFCQWQFFFAPVILLSCFHFCFGRKLTFVFITLSKGWHYKNSKTRYINIRRHILLSSFIICLMRSFYGCFRSFFTFFFIFTPKILNIQAILYSDFFHSSFHSSFLLPYLRDTFPLWWWLAWLEGLQLFAIYKCQLWVSFVVCRLSFLTFTFAEKFSTIWKVNEKG